MVTLFDMTVSQSVSFSEVWMDCMPTAKPNSNDSLANPLNWRRYVAATAAGGSSGC